MRSTRWCPHIVLEVDVAVAISCILSWSSLQVWLLFVEASFKTRWRPPFVAKFLSRATCRFLLT